MTGFALAAAGFACGALPFSVWLPRLRGRDVRAAGDGNPGAVNAGRAAGPAVGVAALLLDVAKAAAPVALARWWSGVGGWWLVPVGLAPVLGHVFSPFLSFRGGKGIAATFGIWSALTLWQGPCLLGALFLLGKFAFRLRDAATVMLGMAGLAALCAFRRDGVLAALALANWGLLAFTHRRELGAGR